MSPTHDRWRSVEELYQAALDRPPAERVAFLNEACPDPELRREVESLLGFAPEHDSLMQHSPWSPSAELEPQKDFGPYRIEQKIGAGGMGEVYRARDNRLGRDVALKILPANMMSDAGRRARFIREAQSAARLNHPGIVTIYDIGDLEGTIYIAMEYVDGKTLGDIVPSTGLALDNALHYAISIAGALAKAHAAGVIHRDLKPGNIMVTSDGLVKVLDFGLAKRFEETPPGDETLTVKPETQSGVVMGTPAFMSPEQAEGRTVDARSDIFSFGSLLYQMVTGKRAFSGNSMAATMAAVLYKEPEPLPASVPNELAGIILRCLRKDPEGRFQSMADAHAALLNLNRSTGAGTANVTPVRAARSAQRWSMWATAAGGVAILTGLAWIFVGPGKTIRPPLTVKPFTSFPGIVEYPSFSPDGNQIAFDWNGEKGDNWDIYVKLVDLGAPLRLTTSPAPDHSPSWSPDGRQIAFIRGAGNGELRLIPALGGTERKLADLNSVFIPLTPAAWTSDGKFLAVRDQKALVLISVASGEKQKLTAPPGGWVGDTLPAISPDGKTLAFLRMQTTPTGDIFLAPVSDGTKARRLTYDNRRIVGLAWSPDGKEIIFSSERAGDPTLWRIPASGGTPERLTNVGDTASELTVARQGGRAAFARYITRGSFWKLDLSPEGLHRPPVRLVTSSRLDISPELSPDGQQIVFGSDRAGSHEIWVCDTQGANAVQLTNMGFTLNPRWSPDGKEIVFAGRPADLVLIFVIPATGGTPRQIGEGRNPSWSRDGRWIYFGSARTGELQTWKIPARGGTAIQVTKGGGGPGIESLDGRFLYYHQAQGSHDLWKVPVEGGQETLVTREKVNFGNYWALGKQGIYFTEAIPAEHQTVLKLFRFETGRSTQIAVFHQPRPLVNPRLSLAADDAWLLYEQVDRSESDIMLIENFR